jgi:hypothetical protein
MLEMQNPAAWLLSEETGEPFRKCVRCRLPLLEVMAPWVVNKEYHHGDCVLEYALCRPCRDRVTEEFSETSKAAIRTYLEQSIDWNSRLGEFMAHDGLAARFEACGVCRAPRAKLEGFGISSAFDAEGHLLEGALPLLVCNQCLAAASAQLSQETRDAWQKFVDSHFDGPPAGQKSFPGSGMSGLI